MTISKVADRGTHAALDAATTSTLTITNPTLIAVGNFLIMRVAADNSGGGGAARTLTIPNSAAGDPRNTWVVNTPSNVDPGAASAGCSTWICYAYVATPYQAGDTIILNWSGNIGANAEVLEEWTGIHAVTPVFATPTNQVAANATTLGTAITGTPNAAGQLFYVAVGWEGIAADTFTQDADTTNGSWSTPTSNATADATRLNNVRITGGYKVVSASGAQSYNPTGITQSDIAACAYIFAPSTDATGAASAAAVGTVTVNAPPATGQFVPVTAVGTATMDAPPAGASGALGELAATVTAPAPAPGAGGVPDPATPLVTSPAAPATGESVDPADLTVTMTGDDATLDWSASPTEGVTGYSVFRRSPATGDPFDPGVDTPIATGVAVLTYDDNNLAEGSYEWQVFGEIGAATWSPLDLPDLVGWYDASDLDSITEVAGAVSQWDDLSGNGHHLTQSTGSKQPYINVDEVNGLPVVRFDAANATSMRASLTQAQPNTILMVLRAENYSSNATVFACASGYPFSYQIWRLDQGFTSTNLINDVKLPDLTVHQVCIAVDGTDFEFYRDATLINDTGDSGTAGMTNGTWAIGYDDYSGSYGLTGDICEVVILGHHITTGERAAWDAYVLDKWGV